MNVIKFPEHEKSIKASDWLRKIAEKIDEDYPETMLSHGVVTFSDVENAAYFYNTPGSGFALRSAELWAIEEAKEHLMSIARGQQA